MNQNVPFLELNDEMICGKNTLRRRHKRTQHNEIESRQIYKIDNNTFNSNSYPPIDFGVNKKLKKREGIDILINMEHTKINKNDKKEQFDINDQIATAIISDIIQYDKESKKQNKKEIIIIPTSTIPTIPPNVISIPNNHQIPLSSETTITAPLNNLPEIIKLTMNMNTQSNPTPRIPLSLEQKQEHWHIPSNANTYTCTKIAEIVVPDPQNIENDTESEYMMLSDLMISNEMVDEITDEIIEKKIEIKTDSIVNTKIKHIFTKNYQEEVEKMSYTESQKIAPQENAQTVTNKFNQIIGRLKVLSKLQAGSKIWVETDPVDNIKVFKIDNCYIPSVARWVYGQSREDVIGTLIEDTMFIQENYSRLKNGLGSAQELVCQRITEAMVGIQNIRQMYSDTHGSKMDDIVGVLSNYTKH